MYNKIGTILCTLHTNHKFLLISTALGTWVIHHNYENNRSKLFHLKDFFGASHLLKAASLSKTMSINIIAIIQTQYKYITNNIYTFGVLHSFAVFLRLSYYNISSLCHYYGIILASENSEILPNRLLQTPAPH